MRDSKNRNAQVMNPLVPKDQTSPATPDIQTTADKGFGTLKIYQKTSRLQEV